MSKQMTFRWVDREFTIDVSQSQQKALADVVMERDRQDTKFGEQNHTPVEWLAVLTEEVGEAAECALHIRFHACDTDWLAKYRAELVQVAAVAIAAIESLDRNELKPA